eukprot:1195600-Prorocentrum_minimum.AAC.10
MVENDVHRGIPITKDPNIGVALNAAVRKVAADGFTLQNIVEAQGKQSNCVVAEDIQEAMDTYSFQLKDLIGVYLLYGGFFFVGMVMLAWARLRRCYRKANSKAGMDADVNLQPGPQERAAAWRELAAKRRRLLAEAKLNKLKELRETARDPKDSFDDQRLAVVRSTSTAMWDIAISVPSSPISPRAHVASGAT